MLGVELTSHGSGEQEYTRRPSVCTAVCPWWLAPAVEEQSERSRRFFLLEQRGGGLKVALGVCYFVPKQKRPAEGGPLSAAGARVKKLGSWVNVFSFAAHSSLCCGCCCLSPCCWPRGKADRPGFLSCSGPAGPHLELFPF